MPQIIVIAGPNGAGKSTAESKILRQAVTFINADEVAKTLVDVPPEKRDIMAGRIVLQQLTDLEQQREDIAIETTLASRSLAPRIARLQRFGYRFNLVFLWLPKPDIAIDRVADRVRGGGHHIPDDVVRRRYDAGLRNFFEIYRPIADKWVMYDSSDMDLRVIARGIMRLGDRELWMDLRERWKNEQRNVASG